MIDFYKLTTEERYKIFDTKKSCEFVVDKITLGFGTVDRYLSSLDLDQSIELPQNIRDKDHLMEILSQDDLTIKGRWARTLAITYFLGGKVIYTKLADDKFKATLTF